MMLTYVSLTLLPLDKMAAISQTIFPHAFSWMKSFICISIWISLKFAPKSPIDNDPLSIGLDNGLTLNRQQAIIWTNADPIHWRIYASLGGDELNHLPLDTLVHNNFKCIFWNENDKILIWFSLKFVPMSPIYNNPALIQVMTWHWTGDKALPEPMLTSGEMSKGNVSCPSSVPPFIHALLITQLFCMYVPKRSTHQRVSS